MTITVDRFEKGVAVCELEDGSFANLPVRFLPPGTREGSKISIRLDKKAEEKDRTRIKAKMNRLFGDRNT